MGRVPLLHHPQTSDPLPASPITVPKEPDVNSLPFGSSTSGKADRTVVVRKILNLLKVWMSGIRNLLIIEGSTNANFILCFWGRYFVPC